MKLLRIFRIVLILIYGLFLTSPLFSSAQTTMIGVTSMSEVTPCQTHIVCDESGTAIVCHIVESELSQIQIPVRSLPCIRKDVSTVPTCAPIISERTYCIHENRLGSYENPLVRFPYIGITKIVVYN